MGKIKVAGIVLFCLMLGGCAAASFLLPQKEYSDIENRTLETKPEWSVSDLLNGEYQEHYEKYLNDQMFLRDGWVGLAAGMERLMGKQDINGVFIGKDGFLLEKYSESDFQDAQAKENIRILSSFLNDAVEKYGKEQVACLLIPDKSDAMPQKLPAYAQTGIQKTKAAVRKLADCLNEPDILLDAGAELSGHQDEYIYYRTDHHWTTLGAYYVYRAWAKKTGHIPGEWKDYDRETVFRDFYGTTYNKVHIRVPADSIELFHHPNQKGVKVDFGDETPVSDSFYFPEAAAEGFDRYRVFLSKNAARIQITTKAATGRSLLIVKDSFANCFVPFLAGDYETILMADCRYGKENIREILAKQDEITDVMVLYQANQFFKDTGLEALDEEAKQMEQFDADSFFDE